MANNNAILRSRAREVVKRLALRTRIYAVLAWIYIKQFAPIFGLRASRRRQGVVLAPYRRSHSLARDVVGIFIVPALALICLVYGFFFGLTAPGLIVPFVVPIVILSALIIWALPHQRTASTLAIEFLYPAFFIALIIWPNYVAVALPGLPWISMLRIIGLPMVGALLINLSISPEFFKYTSKSVNGVPLAWMLMCSFIGLQIVTLIFSKSPGSSAQSVFNDQIYWTSAFVIACVIFRDTRQVERYFSLLCALSIPVIVVTFLESGQKSLLWMNYIPKILTITDPSIGNILHPVFRPGTNVYRAHASFGTPLEESEYLGLLTPLLLYFAHYGTRLSVRISSIVLIPIIFSTIRMTDSQLGVVAMLVSLLLYGVLWSIRRWRDHPNDLLAAATVYTYPILFAVAVGTVFASHRFHDMVFGGSAHAGSTDARNTQLSMAFKAFAKAPWGVGSGGSGDAMGYPPGAFIAIDNYFISLLLEYGALGVIAWYGMFIVAIMEATRHSLSPKYAGRLEARLLPPLAVALSAFLIVKWVHGGNYTHTIDFMMLGMVSALVYNLHYGSGSERTTPSAGGSPSFRRSLLSRQKLQPELARREWTMD